MNTMRQAQGVQTKNRNVAHEPAKALVQRNSAERSARRTFYRAMFIGAAAVALTLTPVGDSHAKQDKPAVMEIQKTGDATPAIIVPKTQIAENMEKPTVQTQVPHEQAEKTRPAGKSGFAKFMEIAIYPIVLVTFILSGYFLFWFGRGKLMSLDNYRIRRQLGAGKGKDEAVETWRERQSEKVEEELRKAAELKANRFLNGGN